MKNKRENEKYEERNDKTGIINLPHTVMMLTCAEVQTAPQRCSSSLSFSLPSHSKYLKSLINKFRDDIKKTS